MAESIPENIKEKENEPEVKTEIKNEPRILQTDDKFPLRGSFFYFIKFYINLYIQKPEAVSPFRWLFISTFILIQLFIFLLLDV